MMQTNKSLTGQINGIKTLEDQHAALAAALDNSAAAYKQWLDVVSGTKDKDQIRVATMAKNQAEALVKMAAAQVPASQIEGVASELHDVSAARVAAQSNEERELAYAPEDRKPEILRRHAAAAEARSEQGATEVAGRDKTNSEIAKIEINRKLAEFEGNKLKKPLEAQIAEATGWASHTVRGFLAGLKKKGTKVETLEKVRMVGPNRDGAKGSFSIYKAG